jgi:hypothetical protein
MFIFIKKLFNLNVDRRGGQFNFANDNHFFCLCGISITYLAG